LSLKDRLNKTIQAGTVPTVHSNVSNDAIFNVAQNSDEFNQLKDKLHGLLVDKVNTTSTWGNYSDEDQKTFIRQFLENQLNTTFAATPLNKKKK